MIFYSNIFSLYKSWIYCRLVIDLIFVDFCISGVDAETAYTRNDFKLLKGDPGLRKQVKLTKNMLGYCTPIVLESNGMSIKSIIIYINLIVQLLQTCCVYNVLFFIHLASLTEIWFEIMFSPPAGSLFTSKKMETENLNLVKKFLQVFAKRIAKTAPAPKCQTCECNSDDNGISYMDCYPCSYPTAANIEYVSCTQTIIHIDYIIIYNVLYIIPLL